MKVLQILAIAIIFTLFASFSLAQNQEQKFPNHLTPNFRPGSETLSSELLKEEPTPEMIDQLLTKIADTDPNQAAKLKNLRKTDPQEFKKAIAENIKERHAKFRDRIRQRYEQHMDWLKENYPDDANELIDLKANDPELYIEKMSLSMKKYRQIREAQDENDTQLVEVLKKELELNKQQHALINDIKDIKNEERKQELTADLKDVLDQKYDIIVQRKQMAYEKMLKKLEELKLEVRKSKDGVEQWKDPVFKEQNIQERLKDTLGKDEKFKWDNQ